MSDVMVRPAVNAGSWYPSNPQDLRQQLDRFFANAEQADVIQPIGLISPHAGYAYSGQTAAYGYRLLRGHQYDRVIVFAPSHHALFSGASIFDGAAYATPLGDIPMDSEFIERLRGASDQFAYYPHAEAREHSIELQLPFLQHAIGGFKLVPILLSERDLGLCRKVAHAVISELAAETSGNVGQARTHRTLVVASSDLYHGPDHKRARLKSERVAQLLSAMDAQAFWAEIKPDEACGAAPIATCIMTARGMGAGNIKVLHLTTSYEVSPGNEDWVVGYLSAAMW